MAVASTAQLVVERIPAETLLVPIKGTAPLITHRFSEKAKKEMLDNMQGRKTPKKAKDPVAEYKSSFYRTKEGWGLPAVAFKSATVSAARFYGKSVSMVSIRQFVFVKGDPSPHDTQLLVQIEGEPEMREDGVTVGRGGSDLRYRPCFPEWSAVLRVIYITSMLTRDSVVSLIDAGGLGVGVGDWRPERSGDFGTYQIDPSREVEVLS